MKRIMESTQRLGRALMLPIAVLPIAGLLLRLGQPDLLDMAAVAAAGAAIFDNLGMLFTVGIAVGLAKENHGAAGLAGLVAYIVATKGAEAVLHAPEATKQIHDVSVPIGILAGIVSGALYNRYHDVKLPDYLAFFSGRRFVPIVAGLAGLVLAFGFGLGYPAVAKGMSALSLAVVKSGAFGLFVYGVLNRVLIVTGLHHILNNLAWFIIGDYQGATGDLNRFFKGDPTAGAFMSGFFPVMMFGLPAACLAMYRTALPARRKAVGGLLMSMALTSFLTGVTEPIEFTFMFLAPALYAVHALLTGAAMVTMDVLNSRMGFGFSAGLFDYALNFNRATHPLYLVPVGAAYFALYYFLFRYFIVRYNLKTPGRDAEEARVAVASSASGAAAGYVAALGGAANLREVAACTTRLRLEVADRARVDRDALKRLGARGTVDVGSNGLQVVVGPIADGVASDIRAYLALGSPSPGDARELLDALGGPRNVESMQTAAGRLLFKVRSADAIDRERLRSAAPRGVAFASASGVHVLHAEPASLEAAIAALLR
jgi:PTS system N-acetylglucosamine-specific IIC component